MTEAMPTVGASSNFGNMLSMAVASLFLPFLPMLPTQILLNNLLYDFSEIGIPFDTVRPDATARPQVWDMRALIRFTAILGPLSSLFDLLTFGGLIFIFHAAPTEFRTHGSRNRWPRKSSSSSALTDGHGTTTHIRRWSSRPS